MINNRIDACKTDVSRIECAGCVESNSRFVCIKKVRVVFSYLPRLYDDRAQSFVLSSSTMHELCNQNISVG